MDLGPITFLRRVVSSLVSSKYLYSKMFVKLGAVQSNVDVKGRSKTDQICQRI